jgi:integrase
MAKGKYEFIGDGVYRRGKTWWLDCQHAGRRHVARLGKGINATVARELAAVERSKFLRGEAGIGGPKRKDVTFDQAKIEFLKWAEANKRPQTLRSYRKCLARLVKTFEGRRLGSLSPFDVERHKRDRVQAGAPIAANRELAVLKALINRCREWKLYEGGNPAAAVKLLREPATRLRYLEADEEAALVGAAREPLRTIILLGIHAGLRIQAEALTLHRQDVDLARGLVTVQAAYAKSGQTRTVPLNRVLRAALAPWKERVTAGEHLFARKDGSAYKSIRTAFKTACKGAGLSDVTPHTLRHTFASRLAMAGVDLRTIQELGGWKQLRMVERYAHLSAGHKAEAVERIAIPGNSPTGFTTPAAVVRLRGPQVRAAVDTPR